MYNLKCSKFSRQDLLLITCRIYEISLFQVMICFSRYWLKTFFDYPVFRIVFIKHSFLVLDKEPCKMKAVSRPLVLSMKLNLFLYSTIWLLQKWRWYFLIKTFSEHTNRLIKQQPCINFPSWYFLNPRKTRNKTSEEVMSAVLLTLDPTTNTFVSFSNFLETNLKNMSVHLH